MFTLLVVLMLLDAERPMALQALLEARYAVRKADIYWAETNLHLPLTLTSLLLLIYRAHVHRNTLCQLRGLLLFSLIP